MRVQQSNLLASIMLAGACGCGSSSDLVIGYQAEASALVVGPCPTLKDCDLDASAEMDDAQGEVHADVELDAAADSTCPNNGPCGPLRMALVHRYSFNGTGTMVTDSVGTAHGTVVRASLSGNGSLTLAGGPPSTTIDQYVDLPNGMIRSLHDATFEAWVVWNGGGEWQRIFDFGDVAGMPEGVRFTDSTSLHVTTRAMSPPDGDVMYGAFKRANQDPAAETRATARQPLPTGVLSQVVLVVDDTHDVMTLYRDGALEGSKPFLDSLSLLNDINNWLGRSQYSNDPPFDGTFYEFRIFNAPLSANAVRTLFLGGTDPAFLN